MELINKIKQYFVSMEMYEGRWVICVRFKPKWGAYSSEDGRINVSADENEPDMWWYYANDESVDIDEIINLIDETVVTNLEAIKKVELFKLKAGELKKIFSDEKLSFKKLQTLKFVFDYSAKEETETEKEPPKQISKKKVQTKKEIAQEIGNVINEHDVFSQDSLVETENEKETKKPRKTRQRQIDGAESLTPNNMTDEEINELRG